MKTFVTVLAVCYLGKWRFGDASMLLAWGMDNDSSEMGCTDTEERDYFPLPLLNKSGQRLFDPCMCAMRDWQVIMMIVQPLFCFFHGFSISEKTHLVIRGLPVYATGRCENTDDYRLFTSPTFPRLGPNADVIALSNFVLEIAIDLRTWQLSATTPMVTYRALAVTLAALGIICRIENLLYTLQRSGSPLAISTSS
jgi:hypothetical protein